MWIVPVIPIYFSLHPLHLQTPLILAATLFVQNQINKNQTQRANIKSSKGKAKNNTQGDPHKDNS